MIRKRLFAVAMACVLLCPISSRAANESPQDKINDKVDQIVDQAPKAPTAEPPVPEAPIVGTVSILSRPRTSIYQMKQWASQKKYKADPDFIALAPLFYTISVRYGVDPAVTYAQAAKETNFMRYTGVVSKDYHNPCGLKITQGGGDKDITAHKIFASWEEGITAQVHHLALYAGQKGFPLKQTPDPRHFKSIYGVAPHVEELGKRWAPSADYGTDIVRYMNEMATFPISSVSRIAGRTRYETSAVLNTHVPTNGHEIVIASGLSFADSLTAATLAKARGCKLYLLPPDHLTEEMIALLKTRQIQKAIVVGGTNTMPAKMIKDLEDGALTVERLAGRDRYETARLIAAAVPNRGKAIVASGTSFADTLSISPAAVREGYRIYLTAPNEMDAATRQALRESGEVLILGGTGSVSEKIEKQLIQQGNRVERLQGRDRYDTSLKIAERFYDNPIVQMFTSGRDFADALSAVGFADYKDGNIILTDGTIRPELENYLRRVKPSYTYIVGGKNSVSDAFLQNLKAQVYDEFK